MFRSLLPLIQMIGQADIALTSESKFSRLLVPLAALGLMAGRVLFRFYFPRLWTRFGGRSRWCDRHAVAVGLVCILLLIPQSLCSGLFSIAAGFGR